MDAPKAHHIQEILHQQGHRLTAARQAIIQTLVGLAAHVTADELVVAVQKEAPHVGRMTVYRTLELLNELGIIRPVYQGGAAAHYVMMADGHHHHLICSACTQVIEFDECILEELSQQLSRRFQFQVHGHFLELYGICPDCRS